ncbi:hypothetical protein FD755_001358 [Muntiacus reevesi]|uniref:GOLD domain-containing protein n=1 Tax=Muntiacus reevesi TaxID=9886 RepID=A0A5J5N2D2_MUNRE|nr:hypothetical protein FD755_001358 [Muntiacus reevesi]
MPRAALGGRRGPWYCRLLLLLFLGPGSGSASEITFELPDNAKQRFHEDIPRAPTAPSNPDSNVLYQEMKKQYDTYTFTASKNGTHKFCFSKEFSTFTHNSLKSVIDYQTQFLLREAQGRSSTEDLNTRVAYWLVRKPSFFWWLA